MTPTAIESPTPVWTPDGCLAAVPVLPREVANDNLIMGNVVFSPLGGYVVNGLPTAPKSDRTSRQKQAS